MNTSVANRGRREAYVVPVDYDQTPQGALLTLDNYLMDVRIGQIIQTLFTYSGQWNEWAAADPLEAEAFFSPPYGSSARVFGYGTQAHTRALEAAQHVADNGDGGEAEGGG